MSSKPTLSLQCVIPGLKLVSEANVRQHWAEKARRVKSQRAITLAVLRVHFGTKASEKFAAPYVVTITRVGPRRLDSDNATGSAKAVRDAVAEWLALDDGDTQRVTFRVQQETGREYAVRIEVVGRAVLS